MRRLARAVAACLLVLGCTVAPLVSPRRAPPDSVLIFEHRRASADRASSEPDWEAWQLYESGRLVYARAGAEPTKAILPRQRLRAARAWLEQHDFELVRSSEHGRATQTPSVTASCQLHLSTVLVLAPLGDPRYTHAARPRS